LLADHGEDLLRIFLQRGRAPPRGIGSHVPSSRKRCTQRIAELALTSKCSAASRREAPASTNSITRTLKCPGYGPRIGHACVNLLIILPVDGAVDLAQCRRRSG
jgi:hypothetical protein